MKTIVSFLLLFASMTLMAQTRTLEVTNSKTGKAITFEQNQRVRIITESREKLVGTLTFQDNETIAIDGTPVKLDNVSSIKYFPKGGRTFKNIVMGTGLGLLVGSGIAAANNNGSAFTLFAVGTGTTLVGGFLGNKNKTYIKRKNTFKIIEQ
ncbi:hypothetical protein [Flavobacterium humi]|uniref:Glycine zipper family protein n=1 Tax=Flavobacterium humi TaxID=2562683 RepID=A0A4Z0LB63_9FLAO|nr:hypothetical protein [Flavobacterium humi]TGD59193.1 hypothetical protein E4635_04905 [Flavobacterium humi]